MKLPFKQLATAETLGTARTVWSLALRDVQREDKLLAIQQPLCARGEKTLNPKLTLKP